MSARAPLAPPDPEAVRRVARAALAEDRARSDVTTRATVPPDQRGRGAFLVKQRGVICGLGAAREVFAQLDPGLTLTPRVVDGAAVEEGAVAAVVEGPLAPMLSGERVALNLLQRLSGVATLARAFAERAAEGGPAAVTDTRKTTPGLRELERYAVRAGGARNHRDTLADGVLIKDNHLAAAARRGVSLEALVAAARREAPHTQRIEVEAADEASALRAIEAGADAVLLDNMAPAEMARVAAAAGGRALLEASGGIGLDTVREVAATGVHLISVGALTHSAPALDISLEVDPAAGGSEAKRRAGRGRNEEPGTAPGSLWTDRERARLRELLGEHPPAEATRRFRREFPHRTPESVRYQIDNIRRGRGPRGGAP